MKIDINDMNEPPEGRGIAIFVGIVIIFVLAAAIIIASFIIF